MRKKKKKYAANMYAIRSDSYSKNRMHVRQAYWPMRRKEHARAN